MRQNTAITVSLWGWRFQHQLIELKNAYEAARAETDRDLKRQETDWNELERKVVAGEASFVEEDEDGRVIYDHGDVAHERMYEIEAVSHCAAISRSTGEHLTGRLIAQSSPARAVAAARSHW